MRDGDHLFGHAYEFVGIVHTQFFSDVVIDDFNHSESGLFIH